MQFMAWDTHARRRIDLVGRKDDGDKVRRAGCSRIEIEENARLVKG